MGYQMTLPGLFKPFRGLKTIFSPIILVRVEKMFIFALLFRENI
jgi:hypothetical protein